MKCLIKCWFDFRTRNVWIKSALVFKRKIIWPMLVWLSNTKCLHRMWFDFQTRNVWINCELLFEYAVVETKVLRLSSTQGFNQNWFDVRTRNVWIECVFLLLIHHLVSKPCIVAGSSSLQESVSSQKHLLPVSSLSFWAVQPWWILSSPRRH